MRVAQIWGVHKQIENRGEIQIRWVSHATYQIRRGGGVNYPPIFIQSVTLGRFLL